MTDSDRSLKRTIVKGGIAVFSGDVLSHVVRFGGNLVLTRLLYPEAFGIMVIVGFVLGALQMLSDVGLRESIITRKNDADPEFINTAWSLMVVRGLALCLVASSLAYPTSVIYENSELASYIAVSSLSLLLAGLASPHRMVHERRIELVRLSVWKLSVQIAALLTTIVWLLIYPTIWALVGHTVVAAVYGSVSSYLFFSGHRPRFSFNIHAAKEMYNFGKWVVIATALTFFARQGDSIFISRVVTPAQLGLFSIGATLARLAGLFALNLGRSLLFPIYSKINNDPTDKLYKQLNQIKLIIFAIAIPLVLFFSVLGEEFIALVYDDRYQNAGWIAELIGLGCAFTVASSVIQPINLAFGHSYRNMWRVLSQAVGLFFFMPLGWFIAGYYGLVVGIVVAQGVDYVIVRQFVAKYGIAKYGPDNLFLITIAGLTLLFWSLFGWPEPG